MICSFAVSQTAVAAGFSFRQNWQRIEAAGDATPVVSAASE
jgi:hypothetical protein